MPEGIEQVLVSTLDQGAVSIQGQVQISLLRIPPDLDTDGLPPGLGDRIVETTDPIDEMVSSIQPQPDFESTVVIPKPQWLLQQPLPCAGFGLRADTPKSKARSAYPVALRSPRRDPVPFWLGFWLIASEDTRTFLADTFKTNGNTRHWHSLPHPRSQTESHPRCDPP